MAQNDKIQLFEDKRIRTAWDEEKEEWYFSVVDVIAVLTDQPDARHASTYWAVLKKRLNNEGAGQLLTNCKQLKMTASDGRKRLTDVADTEQLLRIIQSIPSPKAEPFKLWLAQVGRERIEETIDPELTIDRALETYLKKGYTREWILIEMFRNKDHVFPKSKIQPAVFHNHAAPVVSLLAGDVFVVVFIRHSIPPHLPPENAIE